MAVTIQDGKILVRDGKVGTEQACCCDRRGVCCVCGLYGTCRASDNESADLETTQEQLEAIWNFAGWRDDADDIADWLQNNGYECVEVHSGGIFIDDPSPWYPFKGYSVFFPGVTARCCGSIDCTSPYYRPVAGTFQGDEPRGWPGVNGYDFDPDQPLDTMRVCPCIPDDTTRECIDNQTELQCFQNCGNVFFHASANCNDNPNPCANPLP